MLTYSGYCIFEYPLIQYVEPYKRILGCWTIKQTMECIIYLTYIKSKKKKKKANSM